MRGAIVHAIMQTPGYTLFDTAVGTCGIAWSARGVVAVNLPESDEGTMRRRLARHAASPAEPPPAVRRAIDAIVALLAGDDTADLSSIELDMSAIPEFNRRVFEIARRVGPGSTCTYGEIATQLGDPTAARAVGQALGSNPFTIVVPCHRVVAAGGALGGFSAHSGAATKRRLLEIERAGVTASLFD